VAVSWDFGDGTTGTGASVDHAFAEPGRYIVTVVVTNERGQKGGEARAIYVRGPGSKQTTLLAETGIEVDCPGASQSFAVTVHIRVPSWAKSPFSAGFTIPAGGCPGATKTFVPGSLRLLQGNQGNHTDAWGRPENTLEFEFTVSDGGGTGSMNPGVTAAWN
jgi:PKD domain